MHLATVPFSRPPRYLGSMSGYIGLALLFTTPILALWSDWVVNNSSQDQRNLIGAGYGMAAVAAILRIE